MQGSVSGAIGKIISIWSDKGISIDDYWNSRIGNNGLQEISEMISGDLPKEFSELYNIFDGQKDNDDGTGIFLGLRFMSCAEIVQTMHDIKGFLDDGTEPEPEELSLSHPSDSHIPMFTDGTGNYLGIDTKATARGRDGQMVVFGADYDRVAVPFGSLLQLFNWYIEKDEQSMIRYQIIDDSPAALLLVGGGRVCQDILGYFYEGKNR